MRHGPTETIPSKSSPHSIHDLNEDEVYASLYNHTAIIAREIFDNVQQMRMDRSNIVLNEDGTKSRKSTHYSSKAEGRNR
jgi:hypothetical protein